MVSGTTRGEVVETILELLGRPRDADAIVTDRAGHDLRYAMNSLGSGSNWVGGRSSPTSRQAWRPPSSGTRPTKRGGGRRRPETAYAKQGQCRAMPGLAIKAPIPGLLIISLDIRTDNRGLSSGKLAAPEDGGSRKHPISHRCRTTCRSTTGSGRPAAFTRSLGQARLTGNRADLRCLGRPAPRSASAVASPRNWARKAAIFMPMSRKRLQTLAEQTAYSYLVNDHWTPAAKGPTPSSTSPTRRWRSTGRFRPIMQAVRADKTHPRLDDVRPLEQKQTLIIGAGGQLGRALIKAIPAAVPASRATLDLADPASLATFDFGPYDIVINAAAYAKVDAAETEGWPTRGMGSPAASPVSAPWLPRRGTASRWCTCPPDYVFDGAQVVHGGTEPFSPLGVYGQTKAAGDALVRVP